MYKSPKFNGFAVNLGYIASETEAVDDGISLAVSYGDEALKSLTFMLLSRLIQKLMATMLHVWQHKVS